MASLAVESDFGSLAGLGIVTVLTLLNLKIIYLGPRPGLNQVYQDEDGIAAKGSEAASSDTIPKSFINLGAVIGLSAALFSTPYPSYSFKSKLSADWLFVGKWVCSLGCLV
jgi:hypothetical protein